MSANYAITSYAVHARVGSDEVVTRSSIFDFVCKERLSGGLGCEESAD